MWCPSLSCKIVFLSTDCQVCLQLLKFDRIIWSRCHFSVQGEGGSKSILSKVHLSLGGSFFFFKEKTNIYFPSMEFWGMSSEFFFFLIKIAVSMVQDKILGTNLGYNCENCFQFSLPTTLLNRIFLHSPILHTIHSVDHTGFELTEICFYLQLLTLKTHVTVSGRFITLMLLCFVFTRML